MNIRVLKGKSREEICAATGIKLRTYTDWENQEAAVPARALQKIAKYLDVSMEELLDVGGKPPEFSSVLNAQILQAVGDYMEEVKVEILRIVSGEGIQLLSSPPDKKDTNDQAEKKGKRNS